MPFTTPEEVEKQIFFMAKDFWETISLNSLDPINFPALLTNYQTVGEKNSEYPTRVSSAINKLVKKIKAHTPQELGLIIATKKGHNIHDSFSARQRQDGQ
jgi:hypothetical protein